MKTSPLFSLIPVIALAVLPMATSATVPVPEPENTGYITQSNKYSNVSGRDGCVRWNKFFEGESSILFIDEDYQRYPKNGASFGEKTQITLKESPSGTSKVEIMFAAKQDGYVCPATLEGLASGNLRCVGNQCSGDFVLEGDRKSTV